MLAHKFHRYATASWNWPGELDIIQLFKLNPNKQVLALKTACHSSTGNPQGIAFETL